MVQDSEIRPPRNCDFVKEKNISTCQIIYISNIFKISWPESGEKLEFGVGGFDAPESVPLSQNFALTPLLTISFVRQNFIAE